jgi:hypothetical protein
MQPCHRLGHRHAGKICPGLGYLGVKRVKVEVGQNRCWHEVQGYSLYLAHAAAELPRHRDNEGEVCEHSI